MSSGCIISCVFEALYKGPKGDNVENMAPIIYSLLVQSWWMGLRKLMKGLGLLLFSPPSGTESREKSIFFLSGRMGPGGEGRGQW